jgi:hypothetical protein
MSLSPSERHRSRQYVMQKWVWGKEKERGRKRERTVFGKQQVDRLGWRLQTGQRVAS